MPALKTKPASTNGSASGKATQATPASTVPPSPVSKSLETDRAVTNSSGKPDKIAHDAEQERLKSEIEALQAKLVRCIPIVTSVQSPTCFHRAPSERKYRWLPSLRGTTDGTRSVRNLIAYVTNSLLTRLPEARSSINSRLCKMAYKRRCVRTCCFRECRVNVNKRLKTKDLQAARGKTPFRTVDEVDAHIKYAIPMCPLFNWNN